MVTAVIRMKFTYLMAAELFKGLAVMKEDIRKKENINHLGTIEMEEIIIVKAR